MESVTFTAVLDGDPRPSLILDRQKLVPGSTLLEPVYCNRSGKSQSSFLEILCLGTPEGASLRRWVNTTDLDPTAGQGASTFQGPCGTTWIAYDVENRWRVLQNNTTFAPLLPFDVVTPSEQTSSDYGRLGHGDKDLGQDMIADSLHMNSARAQDIISLTSNAVESVPGLEKQLEAIASHNWASTWLGAVQNWPSDLLQLVHIILLDPSPQCLCLGPNYSMLYNAAYAAMAGDRHPSILGQSFFEAWKEGAELNVARVSYIESTGCPFVMPDYNISLMRNGFLEELHLTWTSVPLRAPLQGFLTFASDETIRKVNERRKAFFTRVSERCRGIREMSHFWAAVLETLGTNSKDFPFAFVYSKKLGSGDEYQFAGALDCDDTSDILPATIKLSESEDGFVSALREASASTGPAPVSVSNGTLPEQISDLSMGRGSKDRCVQGLACAVRRASDQMVLGFLVVGKNTRKTFTPADQAFTTYMVKALGDLATNTITAQESDRLAQLAEIQQQSLIEALASTTLEANHMSTKLQTIVKTLGMVDVGFFEFSVDGKLLQANEAFYKLSGHSRDELSPDSIRGVIHEEDLPHCELQWYNAAAGEHVNYEHRFRTKRPSKDDTDEPWDYTWASASMIPIVDKTGKVTSLSGCLTDITDQKRRQHDVMRRNETLEKLREVQERRAEEAVEAKRQHENFIDMTSHEIRNPLGAVVHCADSIMMSLLDLEPLIKEATPTLTETQTKRFRDIYESSYDSINTILSCTSHQQRMLEDVLTYSKLNSNLLKITPSTCRPATLLQDMGKMFELDAQKAEVSLKVLHDVSSPGNINAEWLKLDIGRLTQILINLVTNAIKFTRQELTRQVTVTMGMTRVKPGHDHLPLEFIPNRAIKAADLDGSEWGHGDAVYLYFIVEDSGCGLTPEEKSRIFSRFSQGSPRTHTKYGGSGLGLYISRELVELQCGEIGFTSQSGVGSKFGFYIKARTTEAQSRGSIQSQRPHRLSSGSIGPRYSILVVEDNVVNQAVLSKQLCKLGHEVHIASDGTEALKFIETTKYWRSSSGSSAQSDTELDVILMDVEMPIMDGLTCAGEIRRLQSEGRIESHLPIIAVSANARAEQISTALACGMDDAISKPFRIVDLMPKIERLMGPQGI